MRNFGDAHKDDKYLDVYDLHFQPWRYRNPRFLEIGVQFGGSLKIWKEYFKNLKLVGVDNLPECKQYEGEDIEIFIGDQADEKFLDSLGGFDIVVDDGGHTMHQQQISFQVLFPKLSSGGIYVIEDLHTSYWGQFQDIELRTTDFIRGLIDDINNEATRSARADVPPREAKYQVHSIHIYESVVIIVKK